MMDDNNRELEILSKKISELIFMCDSLDKKTKQRLNWVVKILYEVSDSISEAIEGED